MVNAGWDIQDGIIEWFDGPEWDAVAEEAMSQAAKDVETYAKNNAVWEDRTGDARRLLKAEVEGDSGSVILTLEHGVEYGYWLEVIQNGRFSIIQSTLELYAPMVFSAAAVRIRSSRSGKRYL